MWPRIEFLDSVTKVIAHSYVAEVATDCILYFFLKNKDDGF